MLRLLYPLREVVLAGAGAGVEGVEVEGVEEGEGEGVGAAGAAEPGASSVGFDITQCDSVPRCSLNVMQTSLEHTSSTALPSSSSIRAFAKA